MALINNLPFALNATLGSVLVIALILANYLRRYTTDLLQRRLFRSLLIYFLIALLVDLASLLFQGNSGRTVTILLTILQTAYYLALMLACYHMAVFFDYMAFGKPERTKKILTITCITLIANAFALLLNCKYGFFFSIDPVGNTFLRGNYYYLRLAFGYIPLVFILGEFFIRHSPFEKPHLSMFFILLFLFAFSSTLDLLELTSRLLWPCGAAAMLYSYFFIVQSDTRIDPLTGIGNRFSFNEFTDRLASHHSGESWAIVMLDMDHFKMINDTLGHQAGDNALRDMAAIIKSNIGREDFAARFGGDEFVLIIKTEKDNDGGISKLMNRFRHDVDQHNSANARPYKLEISYGYDVFTQDGRQSMEAMLEHIDSLMYKNKQERRRSSDKKSEAG